MIGPAPAPLPTRPLLPGLYQVVRLSPDRLLIMNGGRAVALSGSGFAARVTPLLAALDGTNTADDLKARYPEIAPAVLASLAAKGLLLDAAPIPDGPAVGPQSTAVALPGAPSPAESATRLATATVTVVGCGSVGGAVAIVLAKAGVGHLVLVDDGVNSDLDVAVSPVLTLADVGRPRAQAVAQHCRDSAAVDIQVALLLPANVRPDLAVLALGYDDVGTAAADHCLATRLPYLVHMQDALEAGVGPLVGPGGGPCHRCLRTRRLSHVTHLDEHMAYLEHRASTSPGPDAFLAAQVSLVAGLAGTEALRALLGAGARSHGALLTLDLVGPVMQREVLLPVPGCPGCASASGGEV